MFKIREYIYFMAFFNTNSSIYVDNGLEMYFIKINRKSNKSEIFVIIKVLHIKKFYQ